MDDAPDSYKEPVNLKVLRIMVMILTGSMIAGLVTVIVLIVIRFPAAVSVSDEALPLPAVITLPDGTTPAAFTQGDDWYAIVTDDDRILIFNRSDGSLRQDIVITP